MKACVDGIGEVGLMGEEAVAVAGSVSVAVAGCCCHRLCCCHCFNILGYLQHGVSAIFAVASRDINYNSLAGEVVWVAL